MSRLHRALISASFGYLQYAIALISGIVLVPLVLQHVGARAYGLWLASGELLGYAAMVDLGVLGVLPWLFAEADGRRDRDAMRQLLVNGLVVGALVGGGYALLAAGLWLTVPHAFGLGAADRHVLTTPLAMLVMATMVAYPFRVFSGLLAGVQDVTFNGRLAVAQSAIGVAVTLVLLHRGHGLIAVSAASVTSMLLVSAAALARVAALAPDLLTGWPRPSWVGVRTLLTSGAGVWLSGLGWQVTAASNGLVIAGLGRPEWVAVYACTAKMATMATQIAWIVPDAGLVGLAQVAGEGHGTQRVRGLVAMMLRLHLLLAGGAACVLLAVNPAFVAWWVGPTLFGGVHLSTWLALGVMTASLAHGLLAAASVLGHRLRVGVLTLASGGAQVALAWMLGRRWGLPGIAAASLVSALLIVIPSGVVALRPATAMTTSSLWSEIVRPWAVRLGPLGLLSGVAGWWHQTLGLAGAAPLTACLGLAYLWHMRPLYAGLPVDVPIGPRLSGWLTSLGLLTGNDDRRKKLTSSALT